MNNAEESQLKELEKRITKARKKNSFKIEEKQDLGLTRISVELVSGVLLGAFLGFHIDKWLDTSPIFFIICFFFGVAAGILNIYKLASKTTEGSSVDKNIKEKK